MLGWAGFGVGDTGGEEFGFKLSSAATIDEGGGERGNV